MINVIYLINLVNLIILFLTEVAIGIFENAPIF